MELYTKTSYELSKKLTLNYSTSFSQSSKLFDTSIQADIFAIYGFVRIADEIVDTYTGSDKANLLTQLETEAYSALKSGYSTNPIVHAFVTTARKFAITKTLIEPFFASMRMDLRPITYTQTTYEKYIYGSAEVIGLMCLKVFSEGNAQLYKRLSAESRALGAAYQKVNFLRDFAEDYKVTKRVYFPGVQFETFTNEQKNAIAADIKKDFKKAKPALAKLPSNARAAVTLSYSYYYELLQKLELASVEEIKLVRVRISDLKKVRLLIAAKLTQKSIKKESRS